MSSPPSLLHRLLAKGYFAETLPPIFSTVDFANYAIKNNQALAAIQKPKEGFWKIDYSASKSAFRRRSFSLPHPLGHFLVSEFIDTHWDAIRQHLHESTNSLSIPEECEDGEERAIKITSFNILHQQIHKKLGHFRYLVRSDINRYFSSIYTHSIPWAFHGKEKAKKNQSPNSTEIFFNKLDVLIRTAQRKQTIGIPIGPDTSRIISEIIGQAVDRKLIDLAEISPTAILRHVDDFYIGANSREEAEKIVSALRYALREYDLDLNEQKTNIYRSSEFLDETWPRELLRILKNSQSTSYEIFETAFSLADRLKSESPIRFTLRHLDKGTADSPFTSMTGGPSFLSKNWEDTENFLVKCILNYSHSIDYVCMIVIRRLIGGHPISTQKWRDVLNEAIRYQATLGHDHELAWLLWLNLVANSPISDETASVLMSYQNPICALQALHHQKAGLIKNKSTLLDFFRTKVTDESLKDEWWLFAYESARRGWISPGMIQKSQEKFFEGLREEKVSFYLAEATPKAITKYETTNTAIIDKAFHYDDDDDDDEDENDIEIYF